MTERGQTRSLRSLIPIEIARRYEAAMTSHRERGCLPDGWDLVDCLCECEDHRCKAIMAEQAPRCLGCGDAGLVRLAVHYTDPRFGKAMPCPDCRTTPADEIAAYRHRATGLDWSWWESYQMDRLEPGKPPRPQLERWLREESVAKPFLVLIGETGTGKTHAGVAACAYVLRADPSAFVYFTEVPVLLERIKRTFDDVYAKPEDVTGPAARASLLVLDDLGAENPTDWSQEQVFTIINRRYMEQKPTIITSNILPDDVRGQRLWSRVFDERLSRIVPLSGQDRRSAT